MEPSIANGLVLSERPSISRNDCLKYHYPNQLMSKKLINNHATREGWLNAAVDAFRPHFKSAGYSIPVKLHVSCGWPSRGGTASGKHTIGECWPEQASEDKVCQIFISPRLKADPTDAMGVLPTLVHEVVHATVGNKNKHNKVFKKAALAVGLGGKMTSTHAEPTLLASCVTVAGKLGKYPHPALKPGFRLGTKQTTRLVKCECGKCGYSARVTRKWLDDLGSPLCPCNKKAMSFEIPKELEGDDE